MQRLDLTMPTPQENLALDEALLDWAEEEDGEAEFLRIWESPQPIVVVGRSTRVELEVHASVCRERGIPVLRRSSGGAAIVAGPGCLMYAVVLSYQRRPELKDISHAHAYALGRLADALRPILADTGIVQHGGTSDLVYLEAVGSPACPVSGIRAPRKFSGNSLRAKRSHLLYHGTLLYDFELNLVETCLRMPPRVPDYRDGRTHLEFVANLPISRHALVAAVDQAWPTNQALREWPVARVEDLIAARFARDSWNYEFG
ncbi:MAG: hypothetical protein WD738_17900 [Pirellulales bacterium]